MNHWLTANTTEPAVLVTVAIVEGSGPREPGAKMLVTARGQFDTIGGGHLELCALDIGREMLKRASASASSAASASFTSANRLERYALGPSLGQCCGGVVHLAFELLAPGLASGLDAVLSVLRQRRREDSWRLSAIDGAPAALLLDQDGSVIADARGACGQAPALDRKRGTHVLRDAAGRRWLADPCLAPRAQLLLFGAGHVGAAIVRTLAELPCNVTWIDERDDMFPAEIPDNVTVEACDTPAALVAQAPPGSSYLVMTHSHQLDQSLSEAILARDDVGWFGLIGSKTKRMQFEHRLHARGLPADRIAAMVCPVGLPGIASKLPAAIAASVSAQLLMVWEGQQAAAIAASAAAAPLRLVGAAKS